MAFDPNWSSVVLICAFDGVDGSTSVIEDSAARVATVLGNAQIDTAQSKFGGASLLLDGTGDYLQYADNAAWSFGSGAFTIEGWFRFNGGLTADQTFIAHWETPSTRDWAFMYRGASATDVLDFSYSTAGTDAVSILSTAWTPTLGQWYHIAVDRSGNDFRIYVDGVMLSKTTAAVTLYPSSTAELSVGAINDPGTTFFNGWIDELRVSKGLARYASDAGYTVPTAAFPRGSTESVVRVTQASLEQFFATNPPAQITQAALEMWSTTATVTGQALVTQVALEQWVQNPVVSSAQARVMILV